MIQKRSIRTGGRQRERGLALLTAIALLAVISIVAMTFTFSVRDEVQTVYSYVPGFQANDVALAGSQIAMANLRHAWLGADGIPYTGDEKWRADTLEDLKGYAGIMNISGGFLAHYDNRRYLDLVDPRFADMALQGIHSHLFEFEGGWNRMYMRGVDEDPPGELLTRTNWPSEPGYPGTDDDSDGGAGYEDPEVRRAIEANPTGYGSRAWHDDDEDGRRNEDGTDYNFNRDFLIGFGLDADGDRVGLYDECGKIHLNYCGNIINNDPIFRHRYNHGIGSFEIDLTPLLWAILRWDGGGTFTDPGGALVQSIDDAALLAAAIVSYRFGGPPDPDNTSAPGMPAFDDNYNSRQYAAELLRLNPSRPMDGNIGDFFDTNLSGFVDDPWEICIGINNLDDTGDGYPDRLGEGVDEPWEFRTRPRVGVPGNNDRPYDTIEALKLAVNGRLGSPLSVELNITQNTFVDVPPSLTGPQQDEMMAARTLFRTSPFDVLREYVTVSSSAPQLIPGNWTRITDRVTGETITTTLPCQNPNQLSNLIPLSSRKRTIDFLYPLQIDNDGDWNPRDHDLNGNNRPDGNWDGEGDWSGNLISGFDPEPMVSEDPWGDANLDGYPGVGFSLRYNNTNNRNPFGSIYYGAWDEESPHPLVANPDAVNPDTLEKYGYGLDLYGFLGANAELVWELLADDDGDGSADFDDPEVWAAMVGPQEDRVDNNWNSPIWLYDGIDNDGDGLVDETYYDELYWYTVVRGMDPDDAAAIARDEGVDEPGEWYIPAWDDDEDGRYDEDPPSFQIWVNAGDMIDQPIPSTSDIALEPDQRLQPPQAPDFPRLEGPIPVYSPFYRPGGWHKDADLAQYLTDFREGLLLQGDSPNPGNAYRAYEYFTDLPAISYLGGEALRINEVMAAPFIRVWVGDENVTTQVTSGQGDDYPPFVPPSTPDDFLDVRLDDYWHLYNSNGQQPDLDDKFYIVHNHHLRDGESPPMPLPGSNPPEPETLEISIGGIPDGSYAIRYIVYPPELTNKDALVFYTDPTYPNLNPDGNLIHFSADPGSYQYRSNAGVWGPAIPLPLNSGSLPRVLQLDPVEISGSGPDNTFHLRIVINEQTRGTFGFAGLELLDVNQQYVEIINVCTNRQPMVLGPAQDKRWSIRTLLGTGEEEGKWNESEIMIGGTIQSDHIPADEFSTWTPHSRNTGLVTRVDADDAKGHIRTNYGLPNDYNFLQVVRERTQDSEQNLNMLKSSALFSRQEGDQLILGGTCEVRVYLEALSNPAETSSQRWTMDQVRLLVDTRGRNYRGFQSGERGDPFEVRYERMQKPRVPDRNPPPSYAPNRPFARLFGTKALAVGVSKNSSPGFFTLEADPHWTPAWDGTNGYVHAGYRGELQPVLGWEGKSGNIGDQGSWILRHHPEDTDACYFMPNYIEHETNINPQCGFWVFDLSSILDSGDDPAIASVDIRIFGREKIVSEEAEIARQLSDRVEGRLEQDFPFYHTADERIGCATLHVYRPGGWESFDCGFVKSGNVLISGLNVHAPDMGEPVFSHADGQTYRPPWKVIALEIWNQDENGNRLPLNEATFKYLQFSSARGEMLEEDADDPQRRSGILLGGSAGGRNVTYIFNADRPEHWDGMMGSRGWLSYVSTGQPYQTVPLNDSARLASMITTSFYPEYDSGRPPGSEVEGLININTAPRAVLLCLPWGTPYDPEDPRIFGASHFWRADFRRRYGFARLMTAAVTNLRRKQGPSIGFHLPEFDEFGNLLAYDFDYSGIQSGILNLPQINRTGYYGYGHIQDGPFTSIGDVVRAIRVIRRTLDLPDPLNLTGGAEHPSYDSGEVIVPWHVYYENRGTETEPRFPMLDEELRVRWGANYRTESMAPDFDNRRLLSRFEKDVFSRIANLITVESNVYEVVTRSKVLDIETGESIGGGFNRMIVDRRY